MFHGLIKLAGLELFQSHDQPVVLHLDRFQQGAWGAAAERFGEGGGHIGKGHRTETALTFLLTAFAELRGQFSEVGFLFVQPQKHFLSKVLIRCQKLAVRHLIKLFFAGEVVQFSLGLIQALACALDPLRQ